MSRFLVNLTIVYFIEIGKTEEKNKVEVWTNTGKYSVVNGKPEWFRTSKQKCSVYSWTVLTLRWSWNKVP